MADGTMHQVNTPPKLVLACFPRQTALCGSPAVIKNHSTSDELKAKLETGRESER